MPPAEAGSHESGPRRRWWYWLVLVPLVFGAARALIKYMWWAAMHSALYGVPSKAQQLREADSNINFYLGSLIVLALAGVVLTTFLLSPGQSDGHPHRMRGIARVSVALVLVIGLIGFAAAFMSYTGYFLQ